LTNGSLPLHRCADSTPILSKWLAVALRPSRHPTAYCFATCWVGDGACYTLKPVPGGFVLVVVGVR
jgi:hypothetical protein